MSATDGPDRRCGEFQPHEIRVQGLLDARWAEWLQGMTLTREDGGVTSLTGPPLDQAALHGLLNRIRDLGLPIISLRRLCADHPNHQEKEGSKSND